MRVAFVFISFWLSTRAMASIPPSESYLDQIHDHCFEVVSTELKVSQQGPAISATHEWTESLSYDLNPAPQIPAVVQDSGRDPRCVAVARLFQGIPDFDEGQQGQRRSVSLSIDLRASDFPASVLDARGISKLPVHVVSQLRFGHFKPCISNLGIEDCYQKTGEDFVIPVELDCYSQPVLKREVSDEMLSDHESHPGYFRDAYNLVAGAEHCTFRAERFDLKVGKATVRASVGGVVDQDGHGASLKLQKVEFF